MTTAPKIIVCFGGMFVVVGLISAYTSEPLGAILSGFCGLVAAVIYGYWKK